MIDPYIYLLGILGLLLLLVALASGWIARLPLSYAVIYLGVGVLLGPYGADLIQIQPNTGFLERLSELVVIVSVFSCGLKMNRSLNLQCWRSTIRLIGLLMPLSILAIAGVGYWLLGLPLGVAVLLGAILAPTDPVLASEVQLEGEEDRDELRFGLTSESGLNDALAFPFVYFGLHWIEDPSTTNWIGSWIGVDLIWAVAAGIGMGLLVPQGVSVFNRILQRHRAADVLMEDFVTLSTILLTYSLTEVVNGYGFLAVFVAGVIFRRQQKNPTKRFSQEEFTSQIEKLLEVGTIVLLGSLLRGPSLLAHLGPALIVTGSLFFIIRPVAAWFSTIGLNHYKRRDRWAASTRLLFGWFGIRGVGSLYYLTYALGHGLKEPYSQPLAWITVTTIILSVLIHGITATPLMNWYERHANRQTTC